VIIIAFFGASHAVEPDPNWRATNCPCGHSLIETPNGFMHVSSGVYCSSPDGWYSVSLMGFCRVTQQPFKIPYWATLLALVKPPLSLDNPDAPVNWPHKLLDDFCKQFQGFVDKLQWREMRLCVRLLVSQSNGARLTEVNRFNSSLS